MGYAKFLKEAIKDLTSNACSIIQRLMTKSGDLIRNLAEVSAEQWQNDLLIFDPPLLARSRGSVSLLTSALQALASLLVATGHVAVLKVGQHVRPCTYTCLKLLSKFEILLSKTEVHPIVRILACKIHANMVTDRKSISVKVEPMFASLNWSFSSVVQNVF